MTKTSRARYTLEFKQEAVRLIAAGRHDVKHRHRCAAYGLIQAPAGQAGRINVSQRPGQPVRQRGLQGNSQGKMSVLQSFLQRYAIRLLSLSKVKIT